jgi:hypothetical protein
MQGSFVTQRQMGSSPRLFTRVVKFRVLIFRDTVIEFSLPQALVCYRQIPGILTI